MEKINIDEYKIANKFDKESYEKSFYNHRVNGVHLLFENGNSISTIWGSNTYSDNYNYEYNNEDYSPFDRLGSNTCEVMPNCSDKVKEDLGKMFPNNENGSVFGRLTISQWLEMINYLNSNK